MANPVEEAWNKTRAEGNPEYAGTSPEFRMKLQQVYGAALAGQPESGIVGLEEFERELRSGVKAQSVGAAPGTPTVRDPAALALGEQQRAEETPKGSGAQDSEEKAKRDAAGAGARVEHDEVNSPSAPSAARPMAAEAPGSGSNPLPDDAGDGEGEAAGESEDLSALSVADLKERAKAAGVTGYSSLSKSELVAAVEKAEGGLSALTVAELKDKAREQGVEGFSTMRKDELIAALEGETE